MQHVLTVTFQGHIPSKKNSKMLVKGRMLSSEAYRRWEASEMATLQGAVATITPPYHLIYRFWVGSLMSFDLSNSIESVQDVLVKAGILVDDSWRYVRGSSFELMGMDFDNPRCEVSVYQLKVSEFDLALALLLDKPKFKAEAKRRRVSQKALDIELRRQLTA